MHYASNKRITQSARRLFWLLCLAGAVSCSRQEEQRPPDILAPDQMVEILSDMHLAQADLQEAPPGTLPDETRAGRYRDVLEAHGLTWSELRTSIDYYSRRPEKLTEIYDRVIEALSRKQAEAAAG